MKDPTKGINMKNPFEKSNKNPQASITDKVINAVNSKKVFKK